MVVLRLLHVEWQRMDAAWLRANGMTQVRITEMLGITRRTIAGDVTQEKAAVVGDIQTMKLLKAAEKIRNGI